MNMIPLATLMAITTAFAAPGTVAEPLGGIGQPASVLDAALDSVASPPPHAEARRRVASLHERASAEGRTVDEETIRRIWEEANDRARRVQAAGVAPAALELRIALTTYRLRLARGAEVPPTDCGFLEAQLQALGRSSIEDPTLLQAVAASTKRMMAGAPADDDVTRLLQQIEQRWPTHSP